MSTPPKFKIELPDGDSRVVKVCWTEVKPDGTVEVCVTVSEGDELSKLRLQHAELLGQTARHSAALAQGSQALSLLVQSEQARVSP